jgi:hypothetical protein
MVDVTVSYEASDNCGAVTSRLAVTSNEPVDGAGDGRTSPDWEIVDATHVRLRAERSAFGHGRVYQIAVIAADGAGNESTQATAVAVPHDGRSSIGQIIAELVEWLRRLFGLGPHAP